MPLKNAYGNSPGSLKSPVPAKASGQEIVEEIADFTPKGTATAMPEVTPEPSQQMDEADQLLSQLDEADSLLASLDEPGAEPLPEVADAGPQAPMGDQSAPTIPPEQDERSLKQKLFGDTVNRFVTSFGVTDREKYEKLSQLYGANNVRKTPEGKFQIKKEGDGGFRDFDPDTGLFSLDIINDIADFGRDVAEGAVVVGSRFAQAKGKGKSTAKQVGLNAAGAAVDAVAALKAGDYIAENLLDIPRDPARNGLKEAATVGSIGAGFGTVFGFTAAAMARRRAAQAARVSTVTTAEVSQAAQEIAQASDNLAMNGINMKQGKMVLSPGQTAGDLMPEAKALDFQLSDTGGVRDFFVEQGKLVDSGWDKLKTGIVNTTGRPAEEIFSAAKKTAKLTREVEGKTIGSFRDMAMKTSGNKPLPMSRTAQTTPQFYTEMGFTQDPLTGKIKKQTIQALQEKFPDATPAVLGKFNALISDLEGTMMKNKGALPLSEVDRLYTGFRDSIDNFKGTRAGDDVARALIKVKDSLRDDWTEHIGQTLQEKVPNALDAYKQSLAKYSDIMSAQETMKNVLKKNDLSAHAFANQIFSPAQGKNRVAQMKVLIQDTDPKLWDDLVDKQMTFMQQEAVNPKTGRTDWGKLSKRMAELDKAEVLDQMMTPDKKKLTKDFFTIAEKVDSQFNFKEGVPVDKSVLSAARNLVVATANNVSGIAKLGAGQNLASNVLSGVGKDQALVKWLNGEGLELVTRGMTPKEAGRIKTAIMPILKEAGKTAVRTGIAGARRQVGVRTGYEEQAPQGE